MPPAPRPFPILPVVGGVTGLAVLLVTAVVLWPVSPPVPVPTAAPPAPAPSASTWSFTPPPPKPSSLTPSPAAQQQLAVTPARAEVADEGYLQIVVVPWADVTVDGAAVSTGPLRKIRVSAGPHVVRLVHPDYQPLQRRVTVKTGETVSLTVDLPEEAVPKAR
jgi:serine/threonine-protein kinase